MLTAAEGTLIRCISADSLLQIRTVRPARPFVVPTLFGTAAPQRPHTASAELCYYRVPGDVPGFHAGLSRFDESIRG